MSMTETHRPWLSKTPVGRNAEHGYQWQAKCACGMRGTATDWRDDAVVEAQTHEAGEVS